MKIETTNLTGVLVITPEVFSDSRGFFLESFSAKKYKENGINFDFVQDNISRSSKGVLRGLHFQKANPQGKLVSCLRGAVFDVAVDLRKDSNTFSNYFAIELTDTNHKQLWIPPGFAHGFCVLSNSADFHYKCTSFYDAKDESGIIWNDPEINIDWPIDNPLISNKDRMLKKLSEL